MSTVLKTGTVVSAAKTTAAVMVLVLFASVAGFVAPAGQSPAAAQQVCTAPQTATVNGQSHSYSRCTTPVSINRPGTNPGIGRVWCSAMFGHYYDNSVLNDPDQIAADRLWIAIGILVGFEHVPEGCGLADTFTSACVGYRGAKWRLNGVGDFTTIPGIPDFEPRLADLPSHHNCLTEAHEVKDNRLLDAVTADVCAGKYPAPKTVEFYPELSYTSSPTTFHHPPPKMLIGGVDYHIECCPNRLQHMHVLEHHDGTPGSECHSHLRPRCQTGTTVTYDRINGYGHDSVTIPACPNTVTTAVGATFDIVLDYPRRGHGVFATIGGALKPVTFTATADNFVCRAPSPCGDPTAGRTVPTSVSFDLDLEGLHGYLEGRDDQFNEVTETVDSSSNGVDRWGRLDYSRQIVAYFYRATYTGDGTSANPEQRVAIKITDLNGNTGITGTYQYSVFETFEEWVDDPGHPDGGSLQSRTVTNRYTAPMTARLVDVDGKSISGDDYYNDDAGRIELRIAGFQPVFD